MRLVDLEPRWLFHDKLFLFKCPHCQERWLTCKNFATTNQEEVFSLLHLGLGEFWNEVVVPPGALSVWHWTTDSFETMSVSPSIDASASGHWHGHIYGGEIQ